MTRVNCYEDTTFVPWGPFLDEFTFVVHPITCSDLFTAYVVFGLVMCFASLAAFLGYKQTQHSRRPFKTLYIWMIWVELIASVSTYYIVHLSACSTGLTIYSSRDPDFPVSFENPPTKFLFLFWRP